MENRKCACECVFVRVHMRVRVCAQLTETEPDLSLSMASMKLLASIFDTCIRRSAGVSACMMRARAAVYARIWAGERV
jgi:hypothetical protein